MVSSSLHYMNCSICTYKVIFEVSDLAGIVRVVLLRFYQFGVEIDQSLLVLFVILKVVWDDIFGKQG
jgi:hypothetical protein